MTILRIKKGKNGGKIFLLTCNNCLKHFERKYKKTNVKQQHYCNVSCSIKARHQNLKQNNINLIDKAHKAYLEMCILDPTLRKKVTKKALKTVNEKYKVSNISLLDDVKNKKISSYRKNFGVDHPMYLDIVKTKVYNTMKKNGTCKKISKPEMLFKLYIEENYGQHNIECQKRINNWNIDFYINVLNTHVQIDGIYWHGIGKTDEEIKNNINKRNKSILNTKNIDKKQNFWFEKNNLRLIRITDVELMQNIKQGHLDKISKTLET